MLKKQQQQKKTTKVGACCGSRTLIHKDTVLINVLLKRF